jgi:cell division protein FtsI/penicillin-binding protein 2
MRDRRLRALGAVTCAVLAGAMAAACSSHDDSSDAQAAVTAFLNGWTKHAFDPSVTFVDASGAAVPAATVATQITTYSGDLAKLTPSLSAAKVKVDKDTATDSITVAWPLTKTAVWTYQSVLTLSKSGKTWRVVWSPAVVEPHLIAGTKLTEVRTPAPRGQILDAGGKPIVSAHDVVTVGVEPSLVKDINSLVASLNSAFQSVGVQIDLSGLPAQVQAAAPTAFVTVVTLRREVYEQIRPQIHDLPGTVFREGTQQLAPTRIFAHALLGTVGDVTKERMDASPGRYQIGDQVGYGGIQQAYEDRLGGSPGLRVIVPPPPQPKDVTPAEPTVLFHVDPVPGQPVSTTLDVNYQNAADNALAGEANPAALIAMRISDGTVLAVANGPDATGLDLALTAQVPPGSTFKTVTATNVLESGALTPQTPVDCPASLNVGGRVFTNSEGEVLGTVPLITDFAQSCNTAFASLAPKLGPNGLSTTAAQLGIGVKWNIGLPTYTGSVPPDGSNIDQAAAAFGQGKTLVSPIAMISAVGAVARGHWIAPVLVTDPKVTAPPAGAPLKQATVDDLKQMMRAVVTDGTGRGVLNVPGGPVFGKTGTAEFDSNPDHTHSWFIAFAVFVQNGGLSTAAAVPIAAKFLTAMPH